MIIKYCILIPFLSAACFGYVLSDLNFDRNVDFYDFLIFSNQWLLEDDPDEPNSIGSGTADYFVAASDSPDRVKIKADYVCDGIDDHVEIQAAIDALPDTGGRVMLSSGQFNIGSAIELHREVATEFDTWLTGQGPQITTLKLEDGANCNVIQIVVKDYNAGYKGIADMTIDGSNGYNTSGHGIYARRTGAGRIYNSWLHNLYIVKCAQTGMYLTSIWDWWITNCAAEHCGLDGVYLSGHLAFINGLNIFDNASYGLRISGTKYMITNFCFTAPDTPRGKNPIYGSSLQDSTITNFNIQQWGSSGAYDYSAIYLNSNCERVQISNGYIYGNATSHYGVEIDGNDNLISNINVKDTYKNALILNGNNNVVSNCYFDDGAAIGGYDVLDTGLGNRIINCGGAGYEETVMADSPTLHHWGITKLNSSSGAIIATLPDGQYLGERKTIVMTDATNSSTVTVIHCNRQANHIYNFDCINEMVELVWTGSEWVEVVKTCADTP